MKRGNYTPEGRARRIAAFFNRLASRHAAARVAREIVTGKARPYVSRWPA